MPCDYCGEASGHDVMCPLPQVTFAGGGLATSHWVDAVLYQIGQLPGAVIPPAARTLLTDSWALHDRYATRQAFTAGVAALQASVRSHPHLDLAPAATTLSTSAANVVTPLDPATAPNVATVVDAAAASILAAAPTVKTLASDLRV